MMSEKAPKMKRVCVTGAAGYIGSWPVKNLLERGYTVNATLRDPEDAGKSGHLLSLEGAKERLHLFKADLSEDGTFDAAVDGCQGVFHVAALLDFTKYPEDGFIEPAVKGSLGVLKSCTKARCVRRVVYTSTVAAASPLNGEGAYGARCLDESCWTPVDFITAAKPLIWKYCVSKTLTEQAVVQFGVDNQIEVVAIAPALVAGAFLTPALPFSVRQTLAPIKIQRPAVKSRTVILYLFIVVYLCRRIAVISNKCISELGNWNEKSTEYEEYEALQSLEYVLGSIPLVHIDDVCNAHIVLMESPTVEGRYICSARAFTIGELADFIREKYPQLNVTSIDGDCAAGKVPVSSKKLEEMGFLYKYDAQQIVEDSIEGVRRLDLLP